MQSIFRLPWCSDVVGPKMSDRAAFEKICATPVVEIPVLNKLKRRRTNSPDAASPPRAHPNKKRRPEDAMPRVQPSANFRPLAKAEIKQTFSQTPETLYTGSSLMSKSSMEFARSTSSCTHKESSKHTDSSNPMANTEDALMLDAQPATSEDAASLTNLQQVIENQFNTHILMKHNELRLIDQELAKCQIALEQLRRCELHPFPGDNQLSEGISAGNGPSIEPPPGCTRPSHPAPHGVIDGPYSRHYKQWLLRDPQFDAVLAQTPSRTDSFAQAAGRSTRNSGSARKSVSKPFVFPGKPTDPLQSIPNYPPAASKDKSSPLVLRRSTDGQLVKLICNNCLRGNFSSIQGFLNHCRIAHKVDYKSHDAAAIDCGRPLDEQEAANMPPETHSTPASKPSVSRISTAASTTFWNLVHPFNTAAGAPVASSKSHHNDSPARQPVPSLNTTTPTSAESSLNPSNQLPRLSAHFAKHQRGGDLAKAAASAKQKVDFGVEDDLPSPDASEQSSPVAPVAGSRTVAGMATNGNQPRPPSRKGFWQPTQQRPRPSPLAPALTNSIVKQEHSEIPESPQDHVHNLSPHTADSNPGLVSDHEDDDHGSASEEDETQPEIRRSLPVGGNCSDNMEIDVAVDDDIDEDGVIIRRNSLFAEDERGLRAAGSPSRRLGVGKRSA